jgi:hypothetical protein
MAKIMATRRTILQECCGHLSSLEGSKLRVACIVKTCFSGERLNFHSGERNIMGARHGGAPKQDRRRT